jgi:tetratricopeptide (TPR) repeat protein
MSTEPTADRNIALLLALAGRIDATDPGACNNLGVLYYSKGLHAEAVQAFLQALAIAPRMRVAARNLEVAAANTGACDASIAVLEARLQNDASDLAARRELARLFRFLGRAADASAQLDELLAQEPDDALALREYGVLEQQGGDLRKAQRWFERALAIEPDDPTTRLHLAEVHYHRGANEQSLRELDALLLLDERVAEAHLLRGFVLGDMGYHEAAGEAARRANALDPAMATLESDLSLDPRLAPASGAPAGSVPAIPITRGMLDTPAMLGVVSNQSLARHSLGLAFRQRGYFAEARREFERAAAQGEDATLVRHALAELDLVQGFHADAKARYASLLEERGDDARLWNEHGVALHQAGDVAAAAESYRRALRVDPRYALAYNNLGVALEDLGDGVPAREALQRATVLDATLVRSRLNLARWNMRHRDPMAALAILRELVAFHPTLSDAWHEMGLALLALHRVDEARTAVTTAIEHRPDHAEARYTLAQVLGSLGDHDGALRETQHALGLAPIRSAPRLTVEIALHEECPESVGRLDLLSVAEPEPLVGAEISEDEVAALLPERVPVPVTHDNAPTLTLQQRLDAADGLLANGQYELAQREAQDVLVQCTADVRKAEPLLEAHATALVADSFAAAGVHGEAYERYAQVRALLKRDPGVRSTIDGVERRALLGEIRSACLLGRGAEVIALVERFGSHDTQDADVLALLAASHAALADAYGTRVARSAIDRLLRLDPRSAALLHFVGDAAVQMGESTLAVVLYRRALSIDPTRPSPRVAIAQLLHASGNHLAARLELVAALATAPHFREARLTLARVHRDSQRPAEAITVLAAHLEREPADVDALVALAESLRAANRAEDARTAVQRARRFEPDHPEALWIDGVLLADQGRVRDARSRWGRLIAMAPGSASATRARDALAASVERFTPSSMTPAAHARRETR